LIGPQIDCRSCLATPRVHPITNSDFAHCGTPLCNHPTRIRVLSRTGVAQPCGGEKRRSWAEDRAIDLPMIDFFARGGRLRPSWHGDRLPSLDFPVFVDLYQRRRPRPRSFVSETIGLDLVEEAIVRMAARCSDPSSCEQSRDPEGTAIDGCAPMTDAGRGTYGLGGAVGLHVAS
jgi:hypothetical protein